jgi:hypothetical protein
VVLTSTECPERRIVIAKFDALLPVHYNNIIPHIMGKSLDFGVRRFNYNQMTQDAQCILAYGQVIYIWERTG